MKTSFLPRLVNPPFGDPGLYVLVRHEGRALLFDLGESSSLAAGDLLKLGHVFVSHTHVDHFVGFDRLLRVLLRRECEIDLFGPPGIVANVSGKLAGYTWNLIEGYPLVLRVHEVGEARVESVRLPAARAFRPEPLGARPFDGVLCDEAGFRVRAVHLDHRIPCLGFALEEKTRLHVRSEALAELGVPAGPWLTRLKRAIRAGEPGTTPIRITWREAGALRETEHALGELRRRLLIETRGEKLAYVVDVGFHAENERRVVELARGADVFFCESPFLDADREQAQRRYHLTARQAGTLARKAGAARLETFHFSPRYTDREEELRHEAQATFRGELAPDVAPAAGA